MRFRSSGKLRVRLLQVVLPAFLPFAADVVFPCHVQAAEYANSALATSLGMAPELVDETTLLFRLPQRAGLTASRLFALDNGAYSSRITDGFTSLGPSLGFLGRTHGNGFFLLGQRSLLLGNDALLQGGWGVAWSSWRAGVAVRQGRTRSESNDVQMNGDGTATMSEVSRTLSNWDVSAGMGLGDQGAAVDVSLDVRRPKVEFHSISVREETTLTHLESEDETFYEVAGRFRLPLGSGSELVAAGSWGVMDLDIANVVPRGDSVLQRTDAQRLERWSGGILISFVTSGVDWLGLSFHWRHEEVPTSLFQTQLGITHGETITLSAALRERVWREVQAQAGVHLRQVENGSRYVDHGSNSDRSWENIEKRFEAGFSWGLSYVWRRLDARASLQDTLDLGNLFVTVDVIVSL